MNEFKAIKLNRRLRNCTVHDAATKMTNSENIFGIVDDNIRLPELSNTCSPAKQLQKSSHSSTFSIDNIHRIATSSLNEILEIAPAFSTTNFYSNHNQYYNQEPSTAFSTMKRKRGSVRPTERGNDALSYRKDTTCNTNADSRHYPYPPNLQFTQRTLPPFLAHQCIHLRGAKLHNHTFTKFVAWDIIEYHAKNNDGVVNVFESFFGGKKSLCFIEAIKEEILAHGPVVSVSFQLTKAVFDLFPNSKAVFLPSLFHVDSSNSIAYLHPVLIVGWTKTPSGEAWEVQCLLDDTVCNSSGSSVSTSNPQVIFIPFGQFHIDDLCVAPNSGILTKDYPITNPLFSDHGILLPPFPEQSDYNKSSSRSKPDIITPVPSAATGHLASGMFHYGGFPMFDDNQNNREFDSQSGYTVSYHPSNNLFYQNQYEKHQHNSCLETRSHVQ